MDGCSILMDEEREREQLHLSGSSSSSASLFVVEHVHSDASDFHVAVKLSFFYPFYSLPSTPADMIMQLYE